MPDFVNPTTLKTVRSADTMPAPWLVCPRDAGQVPTVERKYAANLRAKTTEAAGHLIYTPDIEAVPGPYRKWVTDHVEEMTAGEKAAADATIEGARQASELDKYDRKEILRATILALIDELNVTRGWIESFKSEVAASSSLADLKTRVAGLPSTPDRTAQQARTAIVNKLGSL